MADSEHLLVLQPSPVGSPALVSFPFPFPVDFLGAIRNVMSFFTRIRSGVVGCVQRRWDLLKGDLHEQIWMQMKGEARTDLGLERQRLGRTMKVKG